MEPVERVVLPRGQSKQALPLLTPAERYVPIGHTRHEVEVVFGANVPSAQGAHVALPTTLANVPGSQGAQSRRDLLPLRKFALPAGHDKHVRAPKLGEKEPTEQFLQAREALAEPGASPNVPGGHC